MFGNEDNLDFLGPILAAISVFPGVPRTKIATGRSKGSIADLLKGEIQRGGDPDLIMSPQYTSGPNHVSPYALGSYGDIVDETMNPQRFLQEDKAIVEQVLPSIFMRDTAIEQGGGSRLLRHELTHASDYLDSYLRNYKEGGSIAPALYQQYDRSLPFGARYKLNPYEVRARYSEMGRDPLQFPVGISEDMNLDRMIEAVLKPYEDTRALDYGAYGPLESQVSPDELRSILNRYVNHPISGAYTDSFNEASSDLFRALGFNF